MPDITLPNTFVDAAVLDAEELTENIFDPNTTPDSFDVFNGWMDRDNRASTEVSREMVQRWTFTTPGVVGATANLDYFYPLFGNYPAEMPTLDDNPTSGATEVDNEGVRRWLAVPGASVVVDVPHDAATVLLLWSITAANDARLAGQSPEDKTVLRLFWEDTPVNAHRRIVPTCIQTATTTPFARRHKRDLQWTGFYLRTSVSKGRYNASIRISQSCRQTRVRVRSMAYVAFHGSVS